jgi:hypothetical protein
MMEGDLVKVPNRGIAVEGAILRVFVEISYSIVFRSSRSLRQI